MRFSLACEAGAVRRVRGVSEEQVARRWRGRDAISGAGGVSNVASLKQCRNQVCDSRVVRSKLIILAETKNFLNFFFFKFSGFRIF